MNKKKDNKLIIFGLIVVVILAVIAFSTKREDKSNINYQTMDSEEIQIAMEENIDNMIKNELSKLGERDRMEYYVSTFIKDIENKEYEEAYGMLYDQYRDNFFPTLDSFEEYVKSKFPKLCSVEYTNIERNGDIYVLWVTIKNALSSESPILEMNFVVQENDLNDFVMSFSVI